MGDDIVAYTEKLQNGSDSSLIFDPIPAWLMEVPLIDVDASRHFSNVEVYLQTNSGDVIKSVCDSSGNVGDNEVGMVKGSDRSCSYSYQANATATISNFTAVAIDNEFSLVNIYGDNFQLAGPNKVYVTVSIMSHICNITTFQNEFISCVVGSVTWGYHNPSVLIQGFGLAVLATEKKLFFPQKVYSITPNVGSLAGGQIVTIEGRGLRPNASIYFLGVPEPCEIIAWTTTEIKCRTPASSSYTTSLPTSYPSSQPSAIPQPKPSIPPLISPSHMPTCQPFQYPSGLPTHQPIQLPTSIPTAQPESCPSVYASASPFHPSALPTAQPFFDKPTSNPSQIPSADPTEPPERSNRFVICPSSDPTKQPTLQPISIPIQQPSNFPSAEPTEQPTATPIIEPTQQPSNHPIMNPTEQPITNPILEPTQQPSNLPRANPTEQPTTNPITQPTQQPSNLPWANPTEQPTTNPITLPTQQTSNLPKANPSLQPTSNPKDQPTSFPSFYPYNEPSAYPSLLPSSLPTLCPNSFLASSNRRSLRNQNDGNSFQLNIDGMNTSLWYNFDPHYTPVVQSFTPQLLSSGYTTNISFVLTNYRPEFFSQNITILIGEEECGAVNSTRLGTITCVLIRNASLTTVSVQPIKIYFENEGYASSKILNELPMVERGFELFTSKPLNGSVMGGNVITIDGFGFDVRYPQRHIVQLSEVGLIPYTAYDNLLLSLGFSAYTNRSAFEVLNCTVLYLNFTQLQCQLAAHPTPFGNNTYIISVTLNNIMATSTVNLTYEQNLLFTPTLASDVEIIHISNRGEYTFTVTGTLLTAGNLVVAVGDVLCNVTRIVDFSTYQNITVVSPPLTAGTWQVFANVSSKGAALTYATINCKNLISSVQFDSALGSIGGGTAITIFGYGFSSVCQENEINFGILDFTLLSVSEYINCLPFEMTVRSPSVLNYLSKYTHPLSLYSISTHLTSNNSIFAAVNFSNSPFAYSLESTPFTIANRSSGFGGLRTDFYVAASSLGSPNITIKIGGKECFNPTRRDVNFHSTTQFNMDWIIPTNTPSAAPDASNPVKGIHRILPLNETDDDLFNELFSNKSYSSINSVLTNDIVYHSGGNVMTGPVNMYNIFYGTFADPTTPTLMNYFAAHIGSSPWYTTMRHYYYQTSPKSQKSFVSGIVNFVTSVSVPASTTSLSQSTVSNLVDYYISSGLLPYDANGIYAFIYNGGLNFPGWLTQWCGFHSVSGAGHKYFVVGDPSSGGSAQAGCEGIRGTTVNNNLGADSMVSVYAHELVESVSDYYGNAWFSPNGEENGDLCAWNFGTLLPGKSNANVVVGAKQFYIQQNWLPGVGCVLSDGLFYTSAPTTSLTLAPSKHISLTASYDVKVECFLPFLTASSAPYDVLVDVYPMGYAVVNDSTKFLLPKYFSLLEVQPLTTVASGIFGGITLSLSGRGFSSDLTITVCGIKCLHIGSNSDTNYSCVTPTHLTLKAVEEVQTLGLVNSLIGSVTNSFYSFPAPYVGSLDALYDGDYTTYAEFNSLSCRVGVETPAGYLVSPLRMRFYPQLQHAVDFNIVSFEGSSDGINFVSFGSVSSIHEGWNFINAPVVNMSQWYKYLRLRVDDTSKASKCALAELEFLGIVAASNDTCPIVVTSNLTNTEVTAGYVKYESITTFTPIIREVSPNNGTALGGTKVTLIGDHLQPIDSMNAGILVSFSGVQCSVIYSNATTIVCITGVRHPSDIEVSKIVVLIPGRGYAAINSSASYLYIDKWSALTSWQYQEPPVDGDIVWIPDGQVILLDKNTPILVFLLVQGALYFDRTKDISVDAYYIFVLGGYMEIGTEEEPFERSVVITLHGDRYQTLEVPPIGSKCLAVANKGVPYTTFATGAHQSGRYVGQLEVHGQKRLRTWTFVNTTAFAGNNWLITSEPVDFKAGESVILTNSEIPSGQFINGFGYEELVVAETRNGHNVSFTTPLLYDHRSEIIEIHGWTIDMRCEIGLLSRNIIIQGSNDTSDGQLYGAHTVAMMSGIYRIENTEFRRCGQAFNFGRYCSHSHRGGNMEGSYVKANSIHHSYQRAVTTHDTDNWEVRDNVAFNVKGHAYFVEDGTELYNSITGNLGVLSRVSSDLLPSDKEPSIFWASTPRNFWRDNVAAHSEANGMWFEFPSSINLDPGEPQTCPQGHVLGEFRNNTFHSNADSGFKIYQVWLPVESECNPGSPPAPQYLYGLNAFRNGNHGLAGGSCAQHGSIHHRDYKLVENGGDESFFGGNYINIYDMNPVFQNCLFVGTIDPHFHENEAVGKCGIPVPR